MQNFLYSRSELHSNYLTLSWQLIPGHEVVGIIAAVGKGVKGFLEGDHCVADPGITVRHVPGLLHVRQFFSTNRNFQCEQCFYCRRGQSLLCENFNGLGVTMAGGFAEYVVL